MASVPFYFFAVGSFNGFFTGSIAGSGFSFVLGPGARFQGCVPVPRAPSLLPRGIERGAQPRAEALLPRPGALPLPMLESVQPLGLEPQP